MGALLCITECVLAQEHKGRAAILCMLVHLTHGIPSYGDHAMTLESEVAQLCPTLCNPMDYSLPGSSIYGILQARILKWVAISFSRGSS